MRHFTVPLYEEGTAEGARKAWLARKRGQAHVLANASAEAHLSSEHAEGSSSSASTPVGHAAAREAQREAADRHVEAAQLHREAGSFASAVKHEEAAGLHRKKSFRHKVWGMGK